MFLLVSSRRLCDILGNMGASVEYVYLNGKYVPRQEAMVPVEDRGMRFGDGVFDTIYVQDGMPYLWDKHYRRLLEGLEACQIRFENVPLWDACMGLIQRNRFKEGLLRITVTRGAGSRGYLPFPDLMGHEPTVIVETIAYHPPSIEEMDALDLTIGLSSYEKTSPKALPTRYKLMQGMNSILARIEAERQGFFDALLLSREGMVSETSAANIFWCIGKTLYTPSLESGCLGGVMRERIIEVSEYKVSQDKFKLRHMLRAEAVFICNSAFLVLPVSKLSGYSTQWNASRKLAKIYRMLIEKDMANELENRKHLAIDFPPA